MNLMEAYTFDGGCLNTSWSAKGTGGLTREVVSAEFGTTSGQLKSGNFADFPCKRHQTKPVVLDRPHTDDRDCAPASFKPHDIQTVEDVPFLEECAVDPGLSPSLRSLVELASKKQ